MLGWNYVIGQAWCGEEGRPRRTIESSFSGDGVVVASPTEGAAVDDAEPGAAVVALTSWSRGIEH